MQVNYHITDIPEKSIETALKAVYCLSADESYRVEHHPLDRDIKILLITLSGDGFLSFDGKSLQLNGGDVIIFSSQSSFNYGCTYKSWSFWWFEFYCENSFFELNTKYTVGIDEFIADICGKCFISFKSGKNKEASSLLSALIGIIKISTETVNTDNPDLDRFVLADLFIRNNIGTANVKAVADYLAVDERTLRNIFSKCSQYSPNRYINELRLDLAKYMLKTTNKTIREISDETGFLNQFYFCSVFKKRYNMTPSAYRKNPVQHDKVTQDCIKTKF